MIIHHAGEGYFFSPNHAEEAFLENRKLGYSLEFRTAEVKAFTNKRKEKSNGEEECGRVRVKKRDVEGKEGRQMEESLQKEVEGKVVPVYC